MKASEVRHVDHGPLAGLDPRLAHDRQAVGDRLDAGVGAAAQRIGADEEQQQAADARAWRPVRESLCEPSRRWPGSSGSVAHDAAADEQRRGSPGRAGRPAAAR